MRKICGKSTKYTLIFSKKKTYFYEQSKIINKLL